MENPALEIPSRAPAATSADDTILPFEVAALDVRGRVVRLGSAVDEILARHNYPTPVAKLLGEAIVLTVLLGSALKIEGRFILQTQTDGPARMLVVDFTPPGQVRACAQLDAGAACRRRRVHRGDRRPVASLARRRHPAAVPAEVGRTPARRRSRSRRCA